MKTITYKQAGVDIEKANNLIKEISALIDTTRTRGSLDRIGGFGGFFDFKKFGIQDPVLVASTDGVGTKLKVAIDVGRHSGVGIDLVAMCVNDLICSGARPLFFLDYFASGKIEGSVWKEVLASIVDGCRQAGCALLGGETAEMPGMYSRGEYDLAGFSVGIVGREKIIDGKKIRPGDAILGIASSGFHSNGYSFVRKVFREKEFKKHADIFLRPTHIYVRPVLDVIEKCAVKGIANITGGGFYDNIPRILPANCGARIKKGSWEIPEVFGMITGKVRVCEKELYRTFNMGIGMVLVLSMKEAGKAMDVLRKRHKLRSWVIGGIVAGKRQVKVVMS